MTADLPNDPLLLGVVICILVVLVLVGLPQTSARGRWAICCGVVVLLLGSLLHRLEQTPIAEPAFLKNDEEIRNQVTNVILLIGFGILAVGLVQRVVATFIGNRESALEHKLAVAMRDQQSTNGLLESLMKSSLNGMLVLRPQRDEAREIVDFECILTNCAAEQIMGRSARKIKQTPIFESFPSLRNTGLFEMAVEVVGTGLPANREQCIRCNGRKGWYEFVVVKHGDGLAVNFNEVTERKQIEEKLRQAALHDALTGLPNRAYLTERLEQCLHLSRQNDTYHFAVLYLDFDRFKVINDSLGHKVGDELLKSIADRLRANLRAIDESDDGQMCHMPARLGGDEFVVLLDKLRDTAGVAVIAERLQRDLAMPHRIAGHEIVSTASIGVVTSGMGHSRAEDMLRDADLAMYQAKASGKARHIVFDAQMHQNTLSRHQFESELRDAVKREAFLLEYQPIVKLATGDTVGFEALIRWPHPTRGIVLPDEFINVAEELGIIKPIGRWAIRQAAWALKRWQELFPLDPPLTMSVNVSRNELVDESLASTVASVLKETGIAPSTLRIEITETSVMTDMQLIAPVLDKLKECGILLSMDDFGTGQSSLSCLDQFPFDILKIDQSFLRSLRKKRDYGPILKSMVELGHNLNMPVIVEGVETQNQLSLLLALNCTYGQGWLFSEALSGAQIEEMLSSDHKWRLAA